MLSAGCEIEINMLGPVTRQIGVDGPCWHNTCVQTQSQDYTPENDVAALLPIRKTVSSQRWQWDRLWFCLSERADVMCQICSKA